MQALQDIAQDIAQNVSRGTYTDIEQGIAQDSKLLSRLCNLYRIGMVLARDLCKFRIVTECFGLLRSVKNCYEL